MSRKPTLNLKAIVAAVNALLKKNGDIPMTVPEARRLVMILDKYIQGCLRDGDPPTSRDLRDYCSEDMDFDFLYRGILKKTSMRKLSQKEEEKAITIICQSLGYHVYTYEGGILVSRALLKKLPELK